MMWVEKMTLRPSARNWRITSRIRSRLTGSRPEKGSSHKTISGSITIASAEAWSLTGNTPQAALDAQYYDWKEGKVTGNTGRVKFNPDDPALRVTLRPMELRTFFIKFA